MVRRAWSRRVLAAVAATAVVGVALANVVLAPSASAAPPVPSVTVDVPSGPGAPLIGETLPVTVTFDNTDVDAAGYGPRVGIFIDSSGNDGTTIGPPDDGLTFQSVTSLGYTLPATVTTVPSCPFSHPITGVSIACPGTIEPGDQFVIVNIPYSSYTPDQPATVLTVNLDISELADLDFPLFVGAIGEFRYGATPPDDPSTDPPILGATDSGTYTPAVARVAKDYVGPEGETTTGPNFVRTFRMSVDVADGQTVDGLTVSDVIPDTFVYAGNLVTPGGSTVVQEPAAGTDPPPAADADRTLEVALPPIVGGSGTDDAVVEFDFYVPEVDSSGTPILDPTTGAPRTLTNTASLGGTWDPVDPRDDPITVSGVTDDAQLVARSIATQKTATIVDDTGATGASPGDTIEWTVETEISDYFTASDLVVSDVLDDGLVWDDSVDPTIVSTNLGTSTGPDPIDPADVVVDATSACPDGTTNIAIDVSSALGGDGVLTGGRVGPTTGPATVTVRYRTIVATSFRCPSGSPVVSENDVLANDVSIGTELLDDSGLPTGGTPSDGSGDSVTVVAGTFEKAIYARNGDTTGPFTEFAEGDEITYRLTQTLEVGNVQDLVITDYLPLPALPVGGFSTTFDTSVPSGVVPVSDTAKYGPAHTFIPPAFPGAPSPTVSLDTVSNSIAFDFGDYEATDGRTSATIDILFTMTITDEPFADGLYLTNIAETRNANSGGEVAVADAVVPFVLTTPVLEISKGVVATDAPGADIAFDPATVGPVAFAAPGSVPSFTPTITSAALDASPVDSDLSGVDADDLVTFALVVQNTGSGLNGAFDVLVNDTLPAGYEIPAGGLNLQVADGGGNALAYTEEGSGLFDPAGGIRLDDDASGSIDPLDELSATTGSNVAVITYDLALATSVEPASTLTNTAAVVHYASTEGGPNFVVEPIDDDATVTTPTPTASKAITDTSADHTTGNEVVIGETVTYEVVVTVPEGTIPDFTITDTLDCGLALVSVDSVVTSANITPTLATETVSDPSCAGGEGAGRSVEWDFGTLVNADTDDTPGTGDDTVTLTYTVAVLNSTSNTDGQARANSVTTSAGGSASAPDVTILDPDPTVTKAFDVETADDGDTVTVTLTVTNDTGIDLFDAELTDPVPAVFTALSGFQCTGTAPTSSSLVGQDVTVTWDTLAAGATTTCTFDAVIDAPALSPGSVTNTASFEWTSLPGDQSTSASPYTDLDVERTGDDADPGQLNDNVIEASDTLTLAAPEITKEILDTSSLDTLGSDVTIGEVVTYELDVTLAEGTYDTDIVVTDQIPAGLDVVDGTVVVDTAALDGTLGTPVVTGGAGSGDDLVVTFPATNVVTPDNDPDDNSFTVTFDAVVADVAEATAGDVLSNTASVTAVVTTTSDPVDVTVVEPQLSVDKDVDGQNADDDTYDADVDEVLDYSIVVVNGTTNASPAYDITVVDVLPDHLDDPTNINLGGTWDPVGRTITWTFAGPFAPGDGLALGYQAEIADSAAIADGTTLVNTATATEYWGFPAGTRAANPDVDYREYSGGSDTVTVTPRFPELVVDKSSTGPALVGEDFTWTIEVSNDSPVADAFEVDVLDVLPANWEFQAGSVGGGTTTADPLVGGSVATGQTLVWNDIADLPAGGSFTITFVAVPTWDARANADHLNQAQVSGHDADDNPGNASGEYVDEDTDDPGLAGGSIGDRVWEDLNGNGIQDPGEPDIDDIEVSLIWDGPDGVMGNSDDESLVATTAPDASYSFDLLPAGDFEIYFDTPPTHFKTYDNQGADDTVDSDPPPAGGPVLVTLTAGEQDDTVDSGMFQVVDLGDLVWHDLDGDGTQDAGEPGLDDVTVTLDYAGPDGSFDGVDDSIAFASTVTSDGGAYGFAGLPPGHFRVTVAPPPGMSFTDADQGADDSVDSDVDASGVVEIDLVSGTDDLTVDAGLWFPATVGDYVWTDGNQDGVQGDPTFDVGRDGVSVELLDAGGLVVDTTVTAGGGLYAFSDVAPGTYSVRVTPPSGLAFTAPLQGGVGTDSDVVPATGETAQFQLSSGETDDTIDAGLLLTGTLGDLVWEDQDGDGVQDAGEPGISGVSVWLDWAGPNGTFDDGDDISLGRQFTDADGLYQFAGVPAGQLRARVTGLPAGLVPTYDLDGIGTPSVAIVTIASPGDSPDDVDFGYQYQADLALTKGVDDPDLDAGETATFTIAVGNSGPSAAAYGPGEVVTVTDTVPVGLTYVAASGTGWTCGFATPTVTCTRPGPLASGATAPDITLTATVDADAPGGPLVNTATVTSPTADPDLDNNTDTAEVTPTLIADLTIDKSHTVDFVAGVEGTWTIQVANDGPSTSAATVADPIVVSDSIPTGLTPTAVDGGADWSCAIASQDVTCNRTTDFLVGPSSPISVTVITTDGSALEADGGTVTNTATVTPDLTPDRDTSNNSDSDEVTVVPSADLVLDKTSGGSFVVGSTATFTFTVTNDGPSTSAADIVLTDTLVTGLTYQSVTSTDPWACSAAGQDITCTLGEDLVDGDVTSFTVTVLVGADVDPTVTNDAHVESDTTFDPDLDNNDDDTSDPSTPTIDLVVDKTHSPTRFQVGATGQFTIAVGNAGPSVSDQEVTLTDTVPASLPVTGITENGWDCSGSSGQSIVCTITTTVAVGGSFPSIVVGVDVEPAAYPLVVNTAVVAPDPGVNEDVTGNNTDSDPVPVDPLVDLTIDKSHTGDFIVGQPASYTFVVTNNGPNLEPDRMTITDDLPVGISYEGFSGAGWTCGAIGQQVVCIYSGLPVPVGGTSAVTIDVSVGVAAEGGVINEARVDTPTEETDTTNNTDDDPTGVDPSADLSVAKTHEGEVVVDQVFEWVLAVENLGPSTSPGPIVVTDTVPDGFTIDDVSGDGWSCAVTGQAFECERAADLAIGPAPDIVVTVIPQVGFEGEAVNTAEVEGPIFDPDLGNNTDDDVVAVGALIDLMATKTLVGGAAARGDDATWSVIIANDGPSTASGVVVVDQLPDGLEYVSASGAGWTCESVGQRVTCVLDHALGDDESAAPLSVVTTVTAAEGTEIVNTVAVRGDGVEAVLSNNLSRAGTLVQAQSGGGVSPDDLATTGASTWPTVRLGLVLFGLGSGLVLAARRRPILRRR